MGTVSDFVTLVWQAGQAIKDKDDVQGKLE